MINATEMQDFSYSQVPVVNGGKLPNLRLVQTPLKVEALKTQQQQQQQLLVNPPSLPAYSPPAYAAQPQTRRTPPPAYPGTSSSLSSGKRVEKLLIQYMINV